MADFYLDHNISVAITAELQSLGHWATTSADLGLEVASDHIHLMTGAARRAILVTHNYKDFLLLQRAWLDWSASWG